MGRPSRDTLQTRRARLVHQYNREQARITAQLDALTASVLKVRELERTIAGVDRTLNTIVDGGFNRVNQAHTGETPRVD